MCRKVSERFSLVTGNGGASQPTMARFGERRLSLSVNGDDVGGSTRRKSPLRTTPDFLKPGCGIAAWGKETPQVTTSKHPAMVFRSVPV
jgi:hypothetical protein